MESGEWGEWGRGRKKGRALADGRTDWPINGGGGGSSSNRDSVVAETDDDDDDDEWGVIFPFRSLYIRF